MLCLCEFVIVVTLRRSRGLGAEQPFSTPYVSSICPAGAGNRGSGRLRSPSPCLNLDILSLDESARVGDVSGVPICISDSSSPPSDWNQVLSGDDLSTAVRAADQQQDPRISDVPPVVPVVDLRINVAPSVVRVVKQLPLVPGDDSQQLVNVVNMSPGVSRNDLPLGSVQLTYCR